MLQKLGFLPGFNKQVTSKLHQQEPSRNGPAVLMYVLDMVLQKK